MPEPAFAALAPTATPALTATGTAVDTAPPPAADAAPLAGADENNDEPPKEFIPGGGVRFIVGVPTACTPGAYSKVATESNKARAIDSTKVRIFLDV